MRYLAGYSLELGRDLNAGLQYYLEQLLDYSDYRAGLRSAPVRDRLRRVVTLQVSKLLLNQNLELSLGAYYSPSDRDAYLMPAARYKCSDHVIVEGGANLFYGEEPSSFFGQFERNRNVYGALRYEF
jgi:hypothetical protein